MFKSIRWTLELWHGGILLLALVGLGSALYLGASHGVRRELDVDLQSTARTVQGRLTGPPHGDGDGDGGGDREGPRRDDPFGFGRRPADDDPTSRPAWMAAGGVPPDWADRVPPAALRRPGVDDRDQPYFVLFARNGTVAQASSAAAAAAVPAPPQRPDGDRRRAWEEATVTFRDDAGAREAVAPLPFGGTVVVGRRVDRLRAQIARLRWVLVGAGGGVLAVGLVGGWVVAGRAIRPIGAISDAASAISTSDLSRRIPVDGTRSELGSLARTLNDTFDRLQRAYDRQVRFTADASHELRTPLSVIHSHATLALRRDRSAEEYKQTIQTCARASRRMKELVDALLTLATADADESAVAREPVDLAAVAQESAALLLPAAGERNVAVTVSAAPATIGGDRTRLSQLVTNLVGNAVRYNRDGGTVLVTVAMEDRRGAVLTVADTGVGIAADDLPHLFERFFRADKARSRDLGGSGLGLAICDGIVRAHGGTIGVQSEVGVGTTVTVRLPATERPA